MQHHIASTREEIAQIAAGYIVDGYADGFAAAKRRAAEELGIRDSHTLPNNREIQRAIAQHQRIFEGSIAEQRIAGMRAEAVQAMQFFADYLPRLVGPVLYGTATAYDVIDLHLFSDEVESVSRRLMHFGINFRLDERTMRTQKNREANFPLFCLERNQQTFACAVLPQQFLQHAPISPLDGKPMRRADQQEVQRLIDQNILYGVIELDLA